jgi:hypothetical protein
MRLDESIHDSQVKLPGYEIIRRDRNRMGGGVAIYIRNCIPYIIRTDFNPENAEAVCLEIKKPKVKPLLVSTWYCPPNANCKFFIHFENFLKKIDNENSEIVITGDFNCDLLKTADYNNPNRLNDLFYIYQLQQHIKTSTRATPSTKTLLDIIITKSDDTKISESGVIELGISDHSMVYICRKVSVPRQKPKIVETRQCKNFNTVQFQNDFEKALRNCLQRQKSANKLFAHIKRKKIVCKLMRLWNIQLRFNTMNRALTNIPRVFTPKALGWETLGTCHNLHMGYKY